MIDALEQTVEPGYTRSYAGNVQHLGLPGSACLGAWEQAVRAAMATGKQCAPARPQQSEDGAQVAVTVLLAGRPDAAQPGACAGAAP